MPRQDSNPVPCDLQSDDYNPLDHNASTDAYLTLLRGVDTYYSFPLPYSFVITLGGV